MSLARRLRRAKRIPDVVLSRHVESIDAAVETLRHAASMFPNPRQLCGLIEKKPKHVVAVLASRAHARREMARSQLDYFAAVLDDDEAAGELRILQAEAGDDLSTYTIKIERA